MSLHLTPLAATVLSGWFLTAACAEPEKSVNQTEPARQAAYSFLLETGIHQNDRPNSLLGPQIIVLGHGFQGKDFEIATLKQDFEEQRAAQNLDETIVTVHDDQGQSRVRELADLVHAHFPGVQVALEKSFPSDSLQEAVDLFIPEDADLTEAQIDLWKNILRLEDCAKAVRKRKNIARYSGLLQEAETILQSLGGQAEESGLRSRHLSVDPIKLKELISRFEPLTEPVEKWDSGAMSIERAAEVRVAEETARRRKELFRRHLQACRRLERKPVSRVEWKSLWPRRFLFRQDFEGPPTPARDWLGEIVTANLPQGSTRALAGISNNKYFARRTRTGIYFDNARAAVTTFVKFQYFINKSVPIGIFVFNMTQGDNWEYTINEPVVGSWGEAFIEVSAHFRKKGGGSAPVKAGDALDDVFIHAGTPGDTDLVLIIDNVQLIGLDI